MATTQKGIYYPDDYTAVADVPEDMKDLAESVDTALGDIEDNIEQNIQPQIDNIQTEQTTQNNDIEALQTENTRLKATLPTTTGSGENITLSNTAELEFIQPPFPGGNSKQATSILPTGYTQLDYIESTGTQYIDTGYTPVQGDDFEFKNVTKENEGALFSAGTGDYQLILISQADGVGNYISYYKYFQGGEASVLSSPSTITNGTIKIKNGNIYYNDILKAQGNYGGAVNTTLNIFRRATNVYYISAKMGEIIITNNGTVKRDYIPCKNASNEVGLYDLVTKTFFGNSGTGTFIAGNTVTIPNPSYPQEITNVTGDVEVLVENRNFIPSSPDRWIQGSISASTGVNITATNRLRTRQYYKVTPLTDYYISVQNTEYEFMNIICYNKSKEYVAGYSNIDYSIVGSTGLAVNLPINTAYIRVVVRKHGNPDIVPSEIATIKPMMELGTTPTTFAEHQEQNFTFPLGTQRMYLGDYLADDGIHHVRKQITFDGSESWYIQNNTFRCTLANAKYNGKVLSNYFIDRNTDNTGDYIWLFLDGYVLVKCSSISTVEDFKTWLSTHNVIVEYELATEEITPYTTAQQTAYDEIKQAISYEEQTNISGSSSESNPIFNVEAYQSIKLVLQEISNAVVALGGV